MAFAIAGLAFDWSRMQPSQWGTDAFRLGRWYRLLDADGFEVITTPPGWPLAGGVALLTLDTVVGTVLVAVASGATIGWLAGRTELRVTASAAGLALLLFATLQWELVRGFSEVGPGIYALMGGGLLTGLAPHLPGVAAAADNTERGNRASRARKNMARSTWPAFRDRVSTRVAVGTVATVVVAGMAVLAFSARGGNGDDGSTATGLDTAGSSPAATATTAEAAAAELGARAAAFVPARDSQAAIVLLDAPGGGDSFALITDMGQSIRYSGIGDDGVASEVELTGNGMVARWSLADGEYALAVADPARGVGFRMTVTETPMGFLLRAFDSEQQGRVIFSEVFPAGSHPDLDGLSSTRSGSLPMRDHQIALRAHVPDGRTAGDVPPLTQTTSLDLEVLVLADGQPVAGDDVTLESFIGLPLYFIFGRDGRAGPIASFFLRGDLFPPPGDGSGTWVGSLDLPTARGRDEVARRCAQTIDDLNNTNTWLGRLGTVFGLIPVYGNAISLVAQAVQEYSAYGAASATDCLDLGDAAEQLLDITDAELYVEVTESQRGHWPERGESIHPDVYRETEHVGVPIRALMAGAEPFTAELTLTLPPLPDIRVGDPIPITRGESLELAAEVVNVPGDYTVTWTATEALAQGGDTTGRRGNIEFANFTFPEEGQSQVTALLDTGRYRVRGTTTVRVETADPTLRLEAAVRSTATARYGDGEFTMEVRRSLSAEAAGFLPPSAGASSAVVDVFQATTREGYQSMAIVVVTDGSASALLHDRHATMRDFWGSGQCSPLLTRAFGGLEGSSYTCTAPISGEEVRAQNEAAFSSGDLFFLANDFGVEGATTVQALVERYAESVP